MLFYYNPNVNVSVTRLPGSVITNICNSAFIATLQNIDIIENDDYVIFIDDIRNPKSESQMHLLCILKYKNYTHVKQIAKHLQGSFTCVILDKNDKTLYFTSKKETSLRYIACKSTSHIFVTGEYNPMWISELPETIINIKTLSSKMVVIHPVGILQSYVD